MILDRERKTRFAGGMFGYLWAYITPVVWITLIVGLFWFLDRTPPIDVGLEIFVATGVLTYVTFRQTVTALSRVLTAHRYMRYFSDVRIDDILWASMLLEVCNLVITSVLIFGTITLLFGAALPASTSPSTAWWNPVKASSPARNSTARADMSSKASTTVASSCSMRSTST